MAPQTVKDGVVVSIAYVLRIDGEVVDEAPASDPLLYLHGADNIIPGLENALTGLSVNDSKTVTIAPADAYGEYDEEDNDVISRDVFPTDVELEAGMMLTMQDEEGNVFDATIVEFDDNEVTLDFNHPLAGETLQFEVTIVGLREPTAEEREHGHPHFPGMHDH